jgi:uncharacterized protein (TIGR00290 family)
MKKRTWLSWSSGKDSAWALHVLRRQPDMEVAGLFCTINQEVGRVALHAVRVEVIRQQAQNIGLPIQLIPIPNPCSNVEYETIMKNFVGQAKQQGIECFAFGDIFLEDVRRYRETNLAASGITPLFPLWGMPTEKLSGEMVKGGLRAIITCVDPKRLSADFAGQEYGRSFLERIPASIDPCGENGEFHTFAYDGPMFIKPLNMAIGETVSRAGFVFTDLLPERQPTACS